MTEPIWNQFLTERDKAVFATSGYGARQGCGKRPALLMIDKAREKGLPVIYTTGVRRGDLWDSGSWAWKNNRSTEDAANKTVISNLDGNEIMAEIAPGPRDIVIY